ncbi:MAG TPA: hypothetical protein VIX19_18950 [Terriglobales bacterium]
MAMRILGFLLLVVAVIAFRQPLTPQATQAADEPTWEYRVVTLDPYRCTSEEAMTATLNASGRQGWELVGYQAAPLQFPKDVEGSILMRPAATGAGKDVSPQLADSFQGTINLKMPQQVQPGACRLVFKREFAGPAHP